MKIQDRYEELVDQFACDDYAVLTMARMIAQLEWEAGEMKDEIKGLESELREAQMYGAW